MQRGKTDTRYRECSQCRSHHTCPQQSDIRLHEVPVEECPRGSMSGGGRMSDIFYTDSVTKQMNSFLHNV